MGIGKLDLNRCHAKAIQLLGKFGEEAKMMPDRAKVLNKMVLTIAEIFEASVVYYDLNTSGRLRAHTSNIPDFVSRSHVQDLPPDGPLKTVIDDKGFVFVPDILRPNFAFFRDIKGEISTIDDNPMHPDIVAKYKKAFEDNFKRTKEDMSVGYGCLSVTEKKFGAFRVDSFASGRSILPVKEDGKPASAKELLDIFAIVGLMASSSLDEIDKRTERETQIEEKERLQEAGLDLINGVVHANNGWMHPVVGYIDMAMKRPEMAEVILPRAKEGALKQQRKLREYFEAKTHIKINIKPTAFNDLLSELDNRFSTRKTHDVEIKVGQGIPEVLSTDMDRLIDVILELVTNAEKYSPEGSKITVGFEKIELNFSGMGALKISISDQGMGIEKDQLHRLFHERNLRLSPEIANGNSSGNGLHVCGRIVKKLGGEIAVDSEKGKGSTFTITLVTS